ncbi:unnamed protein product, partial [Cyprideis torosa]
TDPLLLTGAAATVFSIVCIIGVINAINMIDGADGLAGGIVSISLAALLVIVISADTTPDLAPGLVILLGATAAFLLFNTGMLGANKKIFLGDSGSMFLGIMLASYYIRMSQGDNPYFPPVIAGWIFGLPLMDSVAVMDSAAARQPLINYCIKYKMTAFMTIRHSLKPLPVTPVILAGGSGTRLWPMSRALYPKQFLSLNSEKSLLQETLCRAVQCCAAPPVLVCNEEHRFLTAEQTRATGVRDSSILLEPVARNTAPAIAVAAWHVLQQDADAIMAVMPADHIIADVKEFHQSLKNAIEPAKAGSLATFGILPSRPETGFGYIRADNQASTCSEHALKIQEFVEKPDEATARSYVKGGQYYWNAGIFMFKASTYLEQLLMHEPDMHHLTQLSYQRSQEDLDFIRLEVESFSEIRSESIDFSIMEKASNRVVIPLSSAWSDVGSWEAVHAAGKADENGNVTVGDTMLYDSSNCYINADSRLVATIGLEGIGVIETKDCILVTDLARSQETKLIAQHLQQNQRSEIDLHSVVYRPWGSYESLADDSRFQVKRIIVKPGAKLSSQKHFHRSEHRGVV